ncbi:GNAT family N-acetyltransferase [Komagataeibacter rhaeticus]|uniref:GNAT family N-acetyltransferase n=1 Tax=Komagataeibacter rhaeticus TaxID=215221 RepID=UPI001A46F317|nr:GNAT family N-acetyltransferase [Komagataeibacter rhaeticus]MBL7241335.1 GNAT family N-acetyltransferase [Komagataeibacter rhaeticus]
MLDALFPSLHTRRLCLEPLTIADAPAIQELFPQWEIVRFMAPRVPWPYGPNDAERFVRNVALPGMERGETWHWSIRPREGTDRLMGVISLMDNTPTTGPRENRGFWLAPQWQGQGLMTEAVEAVTDYWFLVLERDVMRTEKAAENAASIAISRKTGMRMTGTRRRDFRCGQNMLAERWEITRTEWLAWKERQKPNSSVRSSRQETSS